MSDISQAASLQDPAHLPPSYDDDYSDDSRPIRWITVATFFNPEDAHIARLQLDSENIPCYISGEHITGTAWHYALAVGGAQVKVPFESAQRAVTTLQPQLKVTVAQPVDHAARCPRCGSTQTRDARTLRRIAGVFLLLVMSLGAYPVLPLLVLIGGFCILVTTRFRACVDCGFEWRGSPAREFDVVSSVLPSENAPSEEPEEPNPPHTSG